MYGNFLYGRTIRRKPHSFYLLLFLWYSDLPIIVCKFSVGRASQKSIATSYNVLEPKERVGIYKMVCTWRRNYLLVMFYSMVGGWMLYYCFRMAKESLRHWFHSSFRKYDSMLESPVTLTFEIYTCNFTCFLDLASVFKGVEKIMKITMLCLFGNHGRTCHKVSYSSGCSRRTQ